MVKVLKSAFYTLGLTEADLFTNSSGADTPILAIETVNDSGSDATAELWITNGSNTHVYPVLTYRTLASGSGVTDKTKRGLPDGYKIRGVSETASVVYVMITYVATET